MELISTYKNRALASLKGYWSDAVVITLLYIAISLVVSEGLSLPFGQSNTAFLGSFASIIILFPIAWALYIWFLSLARGQKDGFGALFNGFRNGMCLKVVATMFVYNLIIAVGLFFLIVPGIYFTCRYAMVPFIMKDNPELSLTETLKLSAEMMEGKKMQYFLLQLSFIGWLFLALLTFGVGMLWLSPYIYTTCAHFYEDAKRG